MTFHVLALVAQKEFCLYMNEKPKSIGEIIKIFYLFVCFFLLWGGGGGGGVIVNFKIIDCSKNLGRLPSISGMYQFSMVCIICTY